MAGPVGVRRRGGWARSMRARMELRCLWAGLGGRAGNGELDVEQHNVEVAER